MKNKKNLLFLSWGVPWPAHTGADLRTMGLLRQLSRFRSVDLFILSQREPTAGQISYLSQFCSSNYWCPMPVHAVAVRALFGMICKGTPFHCAVARLALSSNKEALRKLSEFDGIVYASYGHWGTLVKGKNAKHWILDQQNADVDLWRVYIKQTSNPLRKTAAFINWILARRHFPPIYHNVGAVVAVCQEDRELTLTLAPEARVEVVENGVDCLFLKPNRSEVSSGTCLLFTGTSAIQNLLPLKRFAQTVLPMVRKQIPEIHLLVGGRFDRRKQREFARFEAMNFTGEVDDMRPIFDSSDIYVAPFHDAYGSKLKIAEAMAMAMPIVSTPMGVRGFPLEHKRSVMIARDDSEFVDHVVRLAKDPELRSRLGMAARDLAVKTIDWTILGQRLKHLLNNIDAASD